MKLFQKLQLVGSIIPGVSTTIIAIITFYYCCIKYRKNIPLYILALVLAVILNTACDFLLPYVDNLWLGLLVRAAVGFIPNCFMVLIQAKCMKNA